MPLCVLKLIWLFVVVGVPLVCVCIRGAAEPWQLRRLCLHRGGGDEEPTEPSSEQEQRTGAAEQRQKQRPRPADTTGRRQTHTVPFVHTLKLDTFTLRDELSSVTSLFQGATSCDSGHGFRLIRLGRSWSQLRLSWCLVKDILPLI